MPADAARQRTKEALGDLDDIIRQIRGTAFPARGQHGPPPRPRLPAVTGIADGRSQTVHGAGFPRRGPRPASVPAEAGKNAFSRPSRQWTT